MKRIFLSVLFSTLAVSTVLGQDATQAQIDRLNGQIQDLLAAQEQQTKRIEALAKDISDLRDKLNTPQVSDSASRDDLKNLAEKVQEIDKKRQDDKELILKEIRKLGDLSAPAPTKVKSKPTPAADDTASSGTTDSPQKGYYYTVQSGDTLAAIAKAYRDQGVKVTTTQILKANPGLDAAKLYVGKKIFIPDPNAK